MSKIVEKLNSAQATWYWSLKPGRFVDRLTGKEPNLDIVSVPFTGTLEAWNQSLILGACTELLNSLTECPEDGQILYMPPSLYNRMTPLNLQSFYGNVVMNTKLPYDTCLVEQGDICGAVKVLNINEKGNLV